MTNRLYGFESPGDADLQKILGPFYSSLNLSAQIPVIDAPKITETKKTGGGGGKGGGGKGKSVKSNPDAAAQAKIDKDFEAPETPLETVADPEPPKKEKVLLSNPQWCAPKPGFNEETPISVDIFLPKENAIKTKVTFELFAKTPKGEERICSGEAHAKDGKATCSIPVYIPAYKDEKGKRLQKVEYFFIAKHSEAEPLDGSIAPKVIDEMAERVLESHTLQNVTFVTGKSFVRTSEAADLKALGQAVKDWKGKQPEGKLAVFGHADAVGEDLSNKSLSERRAKSIHAFLAKDPKPWEELYGAEKWGLACIQELLKHLGHDPGTLDGQDGPKTQAAVKDFQGKKGLGSTGNADATTREALFLAYFEGADSPSCGAKDFDAIDGKAFTGCSEYNLIQNTQGECEANRRVAVLLLKVSKNFPIEYPCKQGAILPCQSQVKREGDRRTAGFRCQFYDELVVERRNESREGRPKQVVEYEPAFSTVCGKIIRRTFEIECDDGNDMCVESTDVRWILRLSEAASVPVRSDDPVHYPAMNGVDEIQVNLSATDSGTFADGAEVVLKGYLSHGHSPFHHCPVQLALVEIGSPSPGGSDA